ncbi:MAG: DUF2383 domain-containing protein [Gammaproteobacteria bacterium]
MQEQVRLLGGDPDKRSSVAGTLHRAWVDIKAAIPRSGTTFLLSGAVRFSILRLHLG